MSAAIGISAREHEEMALRRDEVAATLLPRARAALDAAADEVKAHWYDRAAYDAAMDDVLVLERDLETLDGQSAGAAVAMPSEQRPERAIVGTTVTLRDLAGGAGARLDRIATIAFHGDGEFVTAHAPLGRKLLGRRVGETADVDSPGGHARYLIEDVTWMNDVAAPASR